MASDEARSFFGGVELWSLLVLSFPERLGWTSAEHQFVIGWQAPLSSNTARGIPASSERYERRRSEGSVEVGRAS
jgi:hypothetical protein